MEILIYLDTNIYIDYFEGRVDYLRPLGEFAFNVIRKTLGCEFKILFSQIVMREIEYNNYTDKMNALLKTLRDNNKLVNAEVLNSYSLMASKLSKKYKTSFNDVLHFIIAKENNAEIFVTRNIKDFPDFDDYPELVFPENL